MTAETVQKLTEIGASQAAPQKIEGLHPFVVVPNGFRLQSLVDQGEFPDRIHAYVKVYTPETFLEYWNRFNQGASLVFADVQKPSITAIFDYHEPPEGEVDAGARWITHQLQYEFRQTKEWQIWMGSNNRPMKQLEFAQFIENNLDDIVEPASAEMFEMVKHFEAKKNVNFTSGMRLDNGQVQFKYEETITAGAGPGNFVVPDSFKLSLSPFEGSEAYKVKVRFRYRIGQEGLQLRYEVERPHKVIEDAVSMVIAKIQDKLGDKKVLYGSPA